MPRIFAKVGLGWLVWDVAVHFWVQMTCFKVLACVGVLSWCYFLAIFTPPISACISLNEECGGSIVGLKCQRMYIALLQCHVQYTVSLTSTPSERQNNSSSGGQPRLLIMVGIGKCKQTWYLIWFLIPVHCGLGEP